MPVSIALSQCCSREGWPGVVEDLQAQVASDPRAAARSIHDSLRHLDHEIGKLEYELDRLKPAPAVREIWQRRRELLQRRRRDLRSMLPIRAATAPKPVSDDPPAPQLSSTRRRLVAAVETLSKLRPSDLPEEVSPAIPNFMQATMCENFFTQAMPTEQEVESMWLVVIGLTISVSDQVGRSVLWMRGGGLTLAECATALDLPRRTVVQLETSALWSLSAWLARHGG
jgi:hypothetical protein